MWTDFIPAAALLVSGISLIIALTRNAKKDNRESAGAEARTEVKLDSISAGIEDIRVDLRTLRTQMSDFGQRLAAVESSAKSAHHRLDLMESKINN